MTENVRRKIEEKVELGDAVSREQFASAVKGAIQARSTITYLTWKELEAEVGAERATAILGRAHRAFGQIAGAQWEGVSDAQTALLAQCSPGGFAVFQQQLGNVGPQSACKVFGTCPHVEQFRKLGATDEEVRILCQDVLSEGDYGNLDAHEGITLAFDKQIGAGDDCCIYRLTCTRNKDASLLHRWPE